MTRNATRQTQSLHQFLLRLAALVCLTVCATAVQAGSLYRIDLIVFRHLHPQTNETFLQQSGPEPNPEAFLLSGSPDEQQPTYPLASPDNFILTETLRRLRGSANYRALWSGSWTMALAPRRALQFKLAPDSLADNDVSLSGNLSITLSRYLHLDADLALTRWKPGTPGTASNALQDAPFQPVVAGNPAAQPIFWTPWGSGADRFRANHFDVDSVYRLQKKQRSSRDKLYYLDHPYFGILYRFTRVSAPSQDAAATGTRPSTEDTDSAMPAEEPDINEDDNADIGGGD